MKHPCNLCGKPMAAVSDIEIRGIRELAGKHVRGFRCSCGNEHSDPEDVDVLVEYYKLRRMGARVSLFRSGNSWAIRLPASLVRALRLGPDSAFSLEVQDGKIVLTPAP
jgi:hypothetical protein